MPPVRFLQLAEAGRAQDARAPLRRAHAGAALQHDVVGGVEFVHARGQVAERDEAHIGRVDRADLPLVRLAHVDDQRAARPRRAAPSARAA